MSEPTPPPPAPRFTRIKFDGHKVVLAWQLDRPKGGDPDEYALTCNDKPLPSFARALRSLLPDVTDICEWPRSEGANLEVRGVALTYRDGILGACITALKTLHTAPAPLVINTPHLPERPYNESGYVLPKRTVTHLHALHAEAARYLAGERAQLVLFPEPVDITGFVEEDEA